MIIAEKTTEFDKWIRKLKDIRAKSKILFRIQKLETDEYFGDCNLSEMELVKCELITQKAIACISKKKRAKS